MMDPHCARLELDRMANMSYEERGSSSVSLAILDLWKTCHDAGNDPRSDTNLVLLVGSVLGFVILTILWTWMKPRYDSVSVKKKKPAVKRSVSFTSSLMAARVLPKHVNYPEPVINVYIEFEFCPTEEDIMNLVVQKMLQYDRMAKVPVLDERENLTFQSISYDKKKLIRKIVMKCDDVKETQKIIQDHLHDPLDDPRQRQGGLLPWWEIVIFENQGSCNSACLWRIHHSLGDGISLATVAQDILQYADGSPVASVIPQGMMEKKKQSNKMPLYALAWKLWVATLEVMAMPHTPPDDDTVFSKGMNYNTVHTRNREIAVFPTLPLDFVKAIKNAANVSINDVLFTCLSQAIRDYLEEQECPVVRERGASLLCRALIAAVLPRPISSAASDTLQNKWFFLSSDLGVGVSPDNNDILERLQHLHQHLSTLKTSLLPIVGLAIQNYLARYTTRMYNEYAFWNVMCRRSVSISNVPGPGKTCIFANQPAVAVNMFLSNALPHVAFISYAGQISGNVTFDPEAIPNCQSLSRHFKNAVITLADKLNVPVPEELKSAWIVTTTTTAQ